MWYALTVIESEPIRAPWLHNSADRVSAFEAESRGFESLWGYGLLQLDEEEKFQELVDQGVFEFAGWDEDGERMWHINMERAKEVWPDFYWHEKNLLDAAVLDAVDQGFLKMDIDPDTLEVTLEVTGLGDELLD